MSAAAWELKTRQVVQHQVGAYDARSEIGASGRGLAAVVVEDPLIANGGTSANPGGFLGREFGQGYCTADVDPRVGGRGQAGPFEVDGDRGVRVVFRVDVFAA